MAEAEAGRGTLLKWKSENRKELSGEVCLALYGDAQDDDGSPFGRGGAPLMYGMTC
jgi:hypothetical protein